MSDLERLRGVHHTRGHTFEPLGAAAVRYVKKLSEPKRADRRHWGSSTDCHSPRLPSTLRQDHPVLQKIAFEKELAREDAEQPLGRYVGGCTHDNAREILWDIFKEHQDRRLKSGHGKNVSTSPSAAISSPFVDRLTRPLAQETSGPITLPQGGAAAADRDPNALAIVGSTSLTDHSKNTTSLSTELSQSVAQPQSAAEKLLRTGDPGSVVLPDEERPVSVGEGEDSNRGKAETEQNGGNRSGGKRDKRRPRTAGSDSRKRTAGSAASTSLVAISSESVNLGHVEVRPHSSQVSGSRRPHSAGAVRSVGELDEVKSKQASLDLTPSVVADATLYKHVWTLGSPTLNDYTLVDPTMYARVPYPSSPNLSRKRSTIPAAVVPKPANIRPLPPAVYEGAYVGGMRCGGRAPRTRDPRYIRYKRVVALRASPVRGTNTL